MSAAAARRRKQLAAKAAAVGDESTESVLLASSNNNTSADPVTNRLHGLLLQTPPVDEATAYEALQLAQSQLRRFVKAGEYDKATVSYGYDIALLLLQRHSKPSVASQLLTALVQALKETHTPCTEEWVQRIRSIDTAFTQAVDTVREASIVPLGEVARLLRLHFNFLKACLRWSEALGSIRFGAFDIHALEGVHAWKLAAFLETIPEPNTTTSLAREEAPKPEVEGDDEEDEEHVDQSPLALRQDAITHLALAEKPDIILEYLATLPGPTKEQTKMGHICPPCVREELLTRAILLLISVENVRDAHVLLQKYLDTVESRNVQDLKTSYLNKSDGLAPSHPIFLSMLLSIITKADKKVGPLYTWLLKTFASESETMTKNKTIKAYVATIGKVYFDIVPPPSMLSSLENMMAMMGGGFGGGGGAGGMNPALMQAMMQQMQGGGF